MDGKYLTPEELAEILRLSKFTVYAMIKRGELPFVRIGRKLMMPASQLDLIMEGGKGGGAQVSSRPEGINETSAKGAATPGDCSIVICGQDSLLDVLVHELRRSGGGFNYLRNHLNSMQGLLEIYQHKAAATAVHLWDADLDEYNLPYVRHVLPGYPVAVYNLVHRVEGIYVAKGNPKNINGVKDFIGDVRIVNREIGAGARVLLDEKLRLAGVARKRIRGYDDVVTNHTQAASKVANGECDAAVGVATVARQIDNIEFIPLQSERYDLVVTEQSLQGGLSALPEILLSASFKKQLQSLGYDVKDTGRLLFAQ